MIVIPRITETILVRIIDEMKIATRSEKEEIEEVAEIDINAKVIAEIVNPIVTEIMTEMMKIIEKTEYSNVLKCKRQDQSGRDLQAHQRQRRWNQ